VGRPSQLRRDRLRRGAAEQGARDEQDVRRPGGARLVPPLVSTSVLACVLGLGVAAWSSADGTAVDVERAARATSTEVPSVAPGPEPAAAAELTALEEQYDARLGVYTVDAASGRTVVHRPDERFAYASTIKARAVGALLAQTSATDLQRSVPVRSEDLVSAHSPVTAAAVGGGMTLAEQCDAAVRFSEGTALHLLLHELGGPAGLDGALERVGDRLTEVSRTEPALDSAVPGDPRDTTTPRALATTLRAYAVDGAGLQREDRERLVDWLRRNTTGDALVRAGVPTTGPSGTRQVSGVRHPQRRRSAHAARPGADRAGGDVEPGGAGRRSRRRAHRGGGGRRRGCSAGLTVVPEASPRPSTRPSTNKAERRGPGVVVG
jgi:beta-lactamase class A